MSEIDSSPRWKLPLLAVNQLQKDVTHNEALAIIDQLLVPVVAGLPQNSPPATPQPGTLWLVGATPTGAWEGHAHQLAGWSAAGWRWSDAAPGMAVRSSSGQQLVFDGAAWLAPVVLALPVGGMTVDSQARNAITALIQALSAQGVVAAAP